MLKAYQYRLYPTKAQASSLRKTLDICRKVYNNTLALRRDAWEYDQRTASLFETNRELTVWKKEYPYLNEVHSQVLQNVQVRVDLAFKAYFRRVCEGADELGYPRFKGKGRYDSLTYPQAYAPGHKVDIQNQMVTLPKIGKIKGVFHRPVEGDIKTITVRRSSTGKWYLSVAVERPAVIREHPGEEITGIDLGLSSFATLSNGEHIANPRFFRTEEQELARVQRKRDAIPKCSKARIRASEVVARVHERIRNKRSNFIHQTSRQLVDRFKLIAFEDLNIKKMLESDEPERTRKEKRALKRSISDVAWGQMVRAAQNKAVDAGSSVVLINPCNTSQICSRCGKLVYKELKDRVHLCPFCGLSMDRDLNAAINILRLGTQSLSARRIRSPVL
jgi:putative transposase